MREGEGRGRAGVKTNKDRISLSQQHHQVGEYLERVRRVVA